MNKRDRAYLQLRLNYVIDELQAVVDRIKKEKR